MFSVNRLPPQWMTRKFSSLVPSPRLTSSIPILSQATWSMRFIWSGMHQTLMTKSTRKELSSTRVWWTPYNPASKRKGRSRIRSLNKTNRPMRPRSYSSSKRSSSSSSMPVITQPIRCITKGRMSWTQRCSKRWTTWKRDIDRERMSSVVQIKSSESNC